MKSVAFVTPTFSPDLERCELLVRSLDKFAPQTPHYLIVDSFEIPLFRHLQSSRTVLLPAEEVIGLAQIRLHLRQNFWLHWRTLPMRGWIRQQILKMAATSSIDEDVVVCVDSDVIFVRPFRQQRLSQDGKLGLLDVDYVDPMVEKWTMTAERLLGLSPGSVPRRGHVGHLITWSKAHMRALQGRLEEVSGQPWQVAIGRCRTFSEYILYGVFVREILDYGLSEHAPSTLALVRQPWHHDLSTEPGLLSFIAEPEEDNVAVMVHSKFGISPRKVAEIFDALASDSDLPNRVNSASI
ncbi:DUF6492 family protein [Sphingomonas glaciei]|uniref:DUF6492 family protein n=1 Tax=Sphingomonas glaciei TaxID=2938948 RepID=A0ABY5MR73_9SPHN|nr:DUF6492 family protein [Sphingomonas glaciei]UUR06970.1 DUF6492 family protein [Sphingomonas glaciei]